MGLCALVIRQIYRPELDLVRDHDRVDDPSGGVFEDAADDPPRWLPRRLRPSARPPVVREAEAEPEPELTPAQ
jgi:uncharacterized membrane protein